MEIDEDDAGKKTHGTKRPATDDLENDRRFAKRFSRLNLEKTGRAYIPVQSGNYGCTNGQVQGYSNGNNEEIMQVDNTTDRIYIYNLDAELAEADRDDAEAAEGSSKLIFIPDIEKKLSQMPHAALKPNGDDRPPDTRMGQELVLYNSQQPSIALVPDRDKIRQNITEARARSRQRSAQERQANGAVSTVTEAEAGLYRSENGSDAMDVE